MLRVNTKPFHASFCTAIFLFCLASLARESVRPALSQEKQLEEESKPVAADSFAGKALVVPLTVDDLNDPKRFKALQGMLKKATDGEGAAAAVVFELNVAGESDRAANKRLIEELPKITVPSFAFVNPSALGSGSVVAVATDAIYLAPVGIIGGAGLTGDGEVENEEAYKRANAQFLSVYKARARSLAISKGYRPKLVEAFIDADVEFKIGDEVISPKGEILTLTADEAARVVDGKPLLAKGIVKSVEELLKAEGIAAEVFRESPRDYMDADNRSRLSTGKPKGARDAKGATDSKAGEGEDKEEPGLFDRRLEGSYAGKILVMEIGEDALATGEARFSFMERTLKKADADGAAAVIFDIDTPGGYAWYTQGLVLNVLADLKVPTYSFVNSRAESAGAIIAMGTDGIYMRPAATIGSALAVTAAGDIEGDMKSKVDQMAVAMARNVAVLKGHNPDVAEAFVVRTKEVVIDGEVVHEAGEVLNLNTLQATEEYGGRPLLARGVVDSVAEIVEREGLSGEVLEVEPLGLERFAHLVQKFSGLLLLLGLAGAWAELKAPGFGVPGVISLLAFGLFFFGNNMAGNLAGYELAVLLVLGLALLAVEIFFVPGTLIAGLVGGVMVLSALALAMVDRVDFSAVVDGAAAAPAMSELIFSPLLNVFVALVGSMLLVFAMLKYLPNTPGMRWMVLSKSVAGGASLSEASSGSPTGEGNAPASKSLVGSTGEAATALRPAGKGRFGDRVLDITADGEFLEQGTRLVVTRHEGPLIVVEAVTGGGESELESKANA